MSLVKDSAFLGPLGLVLAIVEHSWGLANASIFFMLFNGALLYAMRRKGYR